MVRESAMLIAARLNEREIDMMNVVLTTLMEVNEGKDRDRFNVASSRSMLSEVAILRSRYRVEYEAGLHRRLSGIRLDILLAW